MWIANIILKEVVVVKQSHINLNLNAHLKRANRHANITKILEVGFNMLIPVKEKSWKVLLMKGYVSNDQVKAEQCENCKSISQALTTNFSNPNLFLYGCKDSKCRHRLLRLNFDLDEILQTTN